MSSDRTLLRQEFRQRRQALSASVRQTAVNAINIHLCQLGTLQNASIVAAFMALAVEVDVRPWMRAHWARQGQVVLPRIAKAGAMAFYPHSSNSALVTNQYGIDEPTGKHPVLPAAIDTLLVPLVAYDIIGTRLGMGGGYYDRFLANTRPDTQVIGVAFDCQASSTALPRAEWDIPMHAVVTENGVLEFSSPPELKT